MSMLWGENRYDCLDSVILAQNIEEVLSTLVIELIGYQEQLARTLDYVNDRRAEFAPTIHYIKKKKDNANRVLLLIANRHDNVR